MAISNLPYYNWQREILIYLNALPIGTKTGQA